MRKSIKRFPGGKKSDSTKEGSIDGGPVRANEGGQWSRYLKMKKEGDSERERKEGAKRGKVKRGVPGKTFN